MNFFKNLFNFNKYKSHPEAVIITCFYNPTNSEYRVKAFNQFYESIKHLNHRIIEVVYPKQIIKLPYLPNKEVITTTSNLWHKETLLNKLVKELPSEFKYVFWVDADVIFKNLNWMVEGVEALQKYSVIQPFEYCKHLEKDEEPNFSIPLSDYRFALDDPEYDKGCRRIWRSFASNVAQNLPQAQSLNYDIHSHVGFAYGARKSVLMNVPLYDKALVGGADHIIAHASAGQLNHPCILKSFGDSQEIEMWSQQWHRATLGKLGYVKGDLFHIWHEDIGKRNYLKRIQEFTPLSKGISDKDENGLYYKKDDKAVNYVSDYLNYRDNVITIVDDVIAVVVGNMLTTKGEEYNDSPMIDTGINTQPNREASPDNFAGGGAGGSWEEENFS